MKSTPLGSSSSYPRKLNFGLPMNFEDMMNTGLSLAKESKKYQNAVSQAIPPTPAPMSPMQIWKSQQIHSKKSATNLHNLKPIRNLPNPQILQIPTSPKDPGHGLLPDNFLGKKESVINSVKTDQIHIIGPNCYMMTKVGFKLLGPAPDCRPELKGNQEDEGPGDEGSIWDSLTSIPLVNRFARTLGMGQ